LGGRYLRTATPLSLAGLAGALLGRHSRTASTLSGAALLGASAATRFGLSHAGLASAKDPKYTVRPQRERLARARMSREDRGITVTPAYEGGN
jgi:hypothetical protein